MAVTENIEEVENSRLVIDPSIQPRTNGIDQDHVRALEEAIDELPPIAVVRRGDELVMVDGWHRLAAIQNCGRGRVRVRILELPIDGDLQRLAFELNASHGRPLSLADRRAEASRLLLLATETSDREIGRRCGLSQPTVAKIRTGLETSAQIERTSNRVGKGGYQYSVGGQALGSEAEVSEHQARRSFERMASLLEASIAAPWWQSPKNVASLIADSYVEDAVPEIAEALAAYGAELWNVALELGYKAR